MLSDIRAKRKRYPPEAAVYKPTPKQAESLALTCKLMFDDLHAQYASKPYTITILAQIMDRNQYTHMPLAITENADGVMHIKRSRHDTTYGWRTW